MTSIRTLSLPQRGRWVIEADLRKLALDRKRELRPRYCPICDGYEAIDRRIGVVGPFEGAGRKALFLRTYSRDVWLFATDTPQGRSDLEQRLREAGVRVAGKPVRVQRHSCSISITLEGGTHEKLDVLYPAMGC